MDIIIRRLVPMLLVVLAAQAMAASPRIVLVIGDKYNNPSKEASVAEAVLTEGLTQKGFVVVDKAQLEAVKNQGLAASVLRGDAGAAAQVALSFKADFILAGQVSSDYVTQGGFSLFGVVTIAPKIYRAGMALKIIVAQTGQVITANGDAEGGGAGISDDQAQESAVRSAAIKTLGDVLPKLEKLPTTGAASTAAQIRLTVSGLESFSDATALTKTIAGLSGVTAATRRSFGNGTLELDITSGSSLDDFVAGLEKLTTPRLEIVSVDGVAVVARVK